MPATSVFTGSLRTASLGNRHFIKGSAFYSRSGRFVRHQSRMGGLGATAKCNGLFTPLLVRDDQVSYCSSRIIWHGARQDAGECRGRLSRRYSDGRGVDRKTDTPIGQTACLALGYPGCRESQISAVPLRVVRKKVVHEATLVKIDRAHLSINTDKVHADCRPTVTTFTGTLSTTAWTSGNASSRTTKSAPSQDPHLRNRDRLRDANMSPLSVLLSESERLRVLDLRLFQRTLSEPTRLEKSDITTYGESGSPGGRRRWLAGTRILR